MQRAASMDRYFIKEIRMDSKEDSKEKKQVVVQPFKQEQQKIQYNAMGQHPLSIAPDEEVRSRSAY